MSRFFKDLYELLLNYIKGIAIFIGLIIVVIILIFAFASYKTADSEFCDSCHFMEPYVRHWAASSHADVDCVACHEYSGGDLILSSVKYATETYNTRPQQTRVPDENCLASDCHSMEQLSEELKFKNNIFFKHSVHLDKVLRSGKLHCTSCHNQIVQYDGDETEHMTVNENTCFVCHFKDAGAGEAITGCYSCHGSPETEVEHAGFIFDHKPYLELNVDCNQCHVQIVRGEGNIREDKCHTCHVERSRKDYTEAEIHNTHVTSNGIDCHKCHEKIEHSNFEMVGALDIQCENCHLRQHNKPKQLYMGIGAASGHDLPSYMFRAQVTCTGCHTHITPEGDKLAEQEKKEASRQSCVKCHGEGYDLMFDNWKSGQQKVLKDYRTFMTKAKSDFNTAGGSKKKRTVVQTALSDMTHNYNFIYEGHMVHNIQYAILLLNESVDEFTQAMQAINKSYKAPSAGVGLTDDGSCQTFCHGNAFLPEEVDYEGSDLPHLLHIEDMELACSSCHTTKEHGKTKINDSVCSECH
ncbi:MAG: hypothetical protein DWP97_07900 [Calditrichaeota bacterium]|nr:MAG: hypothetical protein DWP97_07900 [Calditrichota bacterium]